MMNPRRRGGLAATAFAIALMVAGAVTVGLAGTSVSLPLVTGTSSGK
jgi:hypothetical protein